MVEGGSSKDFRHLKGMVYSQPELAHALLDKLARTAPPRVCKPLIGFSDVSALSEGLRQTGQLPALPVSS